MIKSFRHKGLRSFFETGTKQGIRPEHAAKLGRILDRLDGSTDAMDMDLPGFGFHQLVGDRLGQCSVTVSGNWRVVFRFDESDAFDVDYVDYH